MPIFSAGSASVSIVPDFSGAQKAIGEWFARQSDIKVKVKPDLDNADVVRTEAELNAMRGTAHVEVDHNALAHSIAQGIEIASGLAGLDKLGAALTSALKPTLITAVGGAFTALAATASQAAGAVALVPAALTAIAVPAAAVAIGIHGIGAAFKAIDTGNAQKIAETMAKLAPAAQDFVTQVHALGPAWTALRLDVQQQLFAGLGTAVTNLAHVALPILRTGLADTASALNLGLVNTLHALTAEGPQFQTLFANIASATRTAAGAAAPMVQAFVTLASVGSQFLPQLAAGFVHVATAFNGWVQQAAASGRLVQIIQTALDVISQLGRVALDVGRVIGGIFEAAIGPGTVILGVLEKLVSQFAVFVHSADGQTALSSFFTSIQTAVGLVVPALGVLVQVIVTSILPAIGQFAALLAPIARTLLIQFAAVLTQVAAIVPSVVSVMAALIGAMAPLIPVFGQLITLLLPPLVSFFARLAPVISQLAQVMGQALLAAAQAIAPVLPILANALLSIVNAVTPLIPQFVALAVQLLPPLAKAFEAVIAAVTPLVPYLVQIVRELLPPLASIIGALIPIIGSFVGAMGPILKVFLAIVDATVLPVLVALLKGLAAVLDVISPILGPLAAIVLTIVGAIKLWTIAQGLLDIALDANPIGIIVLAIGALIAAVTLIVTHLGALKTAWTDTWNAIKAVWDAVWGWIQTTAQSTWGAISGFFVTAWNRLTQDWQNTWNAVSGFFQTIWNGMVSWVEGIWNALAGWFSNAWNTFTTGWTNFWNAVLNFFHNLWNALVAWIQNLWTTLAGWFAAAWNNYSTAWTNFWNAVFSFFQNLWNSLVNWIHSLWSNLAAWFANVWNAFTQNWQTFWNAIFSFFQNLWNTLVNWVHNLWTNLAGWFQGVWNNFSNAWNNLWNNVSNAFQSVWNGIRNFAQQVWNQIKAIIAAPVNFVIGTILNGGLFKAWNAVNDFLHLPWHINPLPLVSFATGGYTGDVGMFGTGDREDPAGVVHAREFVFTANQVDAAGGPGAMYGLASQLDSGYSMGGAVRQQADDPALHIGSYVVPPSIAPRIKRFLDALSAGQAEAVQAAGGFDALGPGFYWGGYADPVTAAIAFAQAQNGKPYVWGGVGPNGYDCSGYQGAITNVLRGTTPYRRIGTTETFPWSGFQGGLHGAYAVGAFHGNPGHMAGTLDGRNVESGGSHNNVAYTGPAVGADSSQFNIHAYLPNLGGQFVSGGAGGGAARPTSVFISGHSISSAADILSLLTDSITGPINALVGKFGGNNWGGMLAQLPKTLLSNMWGLVEHAVEKAVQDAISAVGDFIGANPNTSVSGHAANVAIVQKDAGKYGWNTGQEWNDLVALVNSESGFNNLAQNPHSTAFGMYQFLNSTWATVGGSKTSDSTLQALYGNKYIKQKYRDPIGAWNYHQLHNSYDTGGWLPPGATTVFNGTGSFEAVLNRAQQDSIVSALRGGTAAGMTLVEVRIGDELITQYIDKRVSHWSDKDSRTIRSGM